VTGALQIGPEWVLGQAAQLAEDANAWLERTTPRLSYDNTQAIDYLGRGVSDSVILVAPRSTQARDLHASLVKSSGRLPVELVETGDVTAATLLRVRDRLPLYTLTHYGDEAWQRQTVLPTLYVWPGEQAAAELETGDERLSSIFVGWLERDRPLLDRFARAYLFGLYHNEDELAYLPGLGEWPAAALGASLGEALDNLMGADSAQRPASLNGRARERAQAFDELDEALEARRQELWQSPGRAAFLRAAAATGGALDRLRRSREQSERDLALYLQALTDQL
jgi:hypothetical protein